VSPCVAYPDGLTVCYSDNEVLRREFEERPRWCFGCRRHVRYNFQLTGSRGPSYYEPTWNGRCPNGCGDRASGGFWYVSWNGGEDL
jgi:hypothetical protein